MDTTFSMLPEYAELFAFSNVTFISPDSRRSCKRTLTRFDKLFRDGSTREAACHAHARRKFYDMREAVRGSCHCIDRRQSGPHFVVAMCAFSYTFACATGGYRSSALAMNCPCLVRKAMRPKSDGRSPLARRRRADIAAPFRSSLAPQARE
jgi:hypothetical protein